MKKQTASFITMIFLLIVIQFSLNTLFAQEKPNILWIITDDQRADALSCYNIATTGNTNSRLGYVESPNIDHLATEGVLFVNSYCNSPACAPSRASMHTGMYPHHSGIYGFEPTHNQTDIYKRTIPEILNSEGYQTAHFGKSGYYIFEWGPGLTWNSLGFYEYSIDNKNQLQRNGLTDFYKEAVWQGGEKIGTREVFYYPDGSAKSFFIEHKDGLSQFDINARIQIDEERDILRAYTRSLDLMIIGGESSMPGDKALDGYTTKAFEKYIEGVDLDFND